MNILHITWLGGHNYGDDMMAETIWNEVWRRDPSTTISIWCEDAPLPRAKTSWIFSGVPRIGFLRRLIAKRAIKKADMLLIGGGSVLHSANSIRWKLEAVKEFKRVHPEKKAIGIALSIGPLAGETEKRLCTELLSLLDACALRDTASYEYASTLGLPYTPIEAADLAGVFVREHHIAPKEAKTTIETMGFFFNLPTIGTYDGLLDAYAKMLQLAEGKYQTLLIYAAACPAGHNDKRFAEAIIKKSGIAQAVEIIEYSDNPISFTEALKQSDYIITSRLHGMVLGYLLGIPVSMISYRNKFEYFADMAGIPMDRRFSELDIDAEKIFSRVSYYSHGGKEKIIELAYRNFGVFDTI